MFHERPLFACLFFSILALAAALVAEFVFAMPPCILCLAQRVPHLLAIILICGVIALKKFYRPALIVLAILYLGGVGTGTYQVGVEQRWWGTTMHVGGEQSCTISDNASDDVSKLYESMSGNPLSDCAHPAFSFHGITFAGMNALLCLMLMGLAIYGVKNGSSREKENN
ncbi:MAG TPA: disulfide bond formation protein B [Alphaproteobacteria bacterium]|nr:disulfide bond formation protein B [Alphaproteobacteria bacterium]